MINDETRAKNPATLPVAFFSLGGGVMALAAVGVVDARVRPYESDG